MEKFVLSVLSCPGNAKKKKNHYHKRKLQERELSVILAEEVWLSEWEKINLICVLFKQPQEQLGANLPPLNWPLSGTSFRIILAWGWTFLKILTKYSDFDLISKLL